MKQNVSEVNIASDMDSFYNKALLKWPKIFSDTTTRFEWYLSSR